MHPYPDRGTRFDSHRINLKKLKIMVTKMSLFLLILVGVRILGTLWCFKRQVLEKRIKTSFE